MKRMNKNWKPLRIIGFWKEINNKVFINSFNGKYELDEIASIIWKMCNGKIRIAEIVEYLKRFYYTVEISEIEKDVFELLQSMEKDDLIILNYDPLFPHKKLHFLNKTEKVK